MKKEEVERPVPTVIKCLFLVLLGLGPCTLRFWGPGWSAEPSKSARRSYRCTRHALRHSPAHITAHTRGPQKRNNARKSYSHRTSHEWSATSHAVTSSDKRVQGGYCTHKTKHRHRKLQVLLFVFVTAGWVALPRSPSLGKGGVGGQTSTRRVSTRLPLMGSHSLWQSVLPLR